MISIGIFFILYGAVSIVYCLYNYYSEYNRLDNSIIGTPHIIINIFAIIVGIIIFITGIIKKNKIEYSQKEMDQKIDADEDEYERIICSRCGNENENYRSECENCGEVFDNGNIDTENKEKNNDWKETFKENNLGNYIKIFEENKLDTFEIIQELNEYDLERLGIEFMGDRKKIIKIIKS